MVLSNLFVLSKGLFNEDAHKNNFMVDNSKQFRVSETSPPCEVVKMIDLGLVRPIQERQLPLAVSLAVMELSQDRTFTVYSRLNSDLGVLRQIFNVDEPLKELLSNLMDVDQEYRRFMISRLHCRLCRRKPT